MKRLEAKGRFIYCGGSVFAGSFEYTTMDHGHFALPPSHNNTSLQSAQSCVGHGAEKVDKKAVQVCDCFLTNSHSRNQQPSELLAGCIFD